MFAPGRTSRRRSSSARLPCTATSSRLFAAYSAAVKRRAPSGDPWAWSQRGQAPTKVSGGGSRRYPRRRRSARLNISHGRSRWARRTRRSPGIAARLRRPRESSPPLHRLRQRSRRVGGVAQRGAVRCPVGAGAGVRKRPLVGERRNSSAPRRGPTPLPWAPQGGNTPGAPWGGLRLSIGGKLIRTRGPAAGEHAAPGSCAHKSPPRGCRQLPPRRRNRGRDPFSGWPDRREPRSRRRRQSRGADPRLTGSLAAGTCSDGSINGLRMPPQIIQHLPGAGRSGGLNPAKAGRNQGGTVAPAQPKRCSGRLPGAGSGRRQISSGSSGRPSPSGRWWQLRPGICSERAGPKSRRRCAGAMAFCTATTA